MEIQKTKLNPKFFFVSLGVMVTLIASTASFLDLLSACFDKLWPDALNAVYNYGYNSYDYTQIRVALAIIIIIFPIFLTLSFVWTKLISKSLNHIEEIIKKWMLYLIIFLASIVVAVDLIVFVKYFIEGEITQRFIFKVLSVLVTAFIGGFYYLSELHEKRNKNLRKIIFAISILMIVVGISLSFCIIGSPKTQRLMRIDEKRLQDLQNLQSQIINIWQNTQKLPNDLKEISTSIYGWQIPVDPEFNLGKNYEYKKTGDQSFEICADFNLPIPSGWSEFSNGAVNFTVGEAGQTTVKSNIVPPIGGTNENWKHDAGQTCFTRKVDKNLYPPIRPM